MRAIWITVPVVISATMLGCGPSKPKLVAPDDYLNELARGSNEFAFDLFNKVAEMETGNIVLSPYSVREALAMAYAGAGGQTKDEMQKVLRFTLPDDRLHAAIGAARQRLEGADAGATVKVANGLWGQKGRGVRPDYLNLTKHFYDGGFQELDFAGRPDDSRRTINRWVARRTDGRIAELLGSGDITSGTALVLGNAVNFRGEWANPFDRAKTQNGTFTRADGSQVSVPMMTAMRGDYEYYQGDGFEVLELPYAGDKLALRVILPGRGVSMRLPSATELAAAEAKVGYNGRAGTVTLPRFDGRGRVGLVGPLQALGMVAAFTAADFSGIAGGLQMANVVHGGEIAVDEEGTRATAGTMVMFKVAGPPPFDFRADRPFYYQIVDRKTSAVLFIGRCSSP